MEHRVLITAFTIQADIDKAYMTLGDNVAVDEAVDFQGVDEDDVEADIGASTDVVTKQAEPSHRVSFNFNPY